MLSGMMGILADFEIFSWLRSTWGLIQVILGFSLVVFVHELGHFLAAKWAKVRVDKFCIGFGPELFGFTWGETRYGFNLLPLGGYVKMLGQEDFAVDKTGELKVKDEAGSFTGTSIGKRMVIVSAGVVMNLVFAAVGLTIYMMVGYRTLPAVVGAVTPGTPASRAGLRPGDKLLAINGSPMHDFDDVKMRIVLSDPGEVLEFDVQRDGKPLSPRPRMLPEFKEDQQLRQIGMSPGWNTTVMWAAGSKLEDRAAEDLQPNDRFKAVVENGRIAPLRTMGDAWDALIRGRGRPVAFQILRPDAAAKGQVADIDAPDPPGKLLTVHAQAQWYVQTETSGEPCSASLLGLVPRLKAGQLEADGPADLGGVEPGDVIVSCAGTDYPNAHELDRLVAENQDRDMTLVVRRPQMANKARGLTASAVRFVTDAREAWLEAAAHDLVKARTTVDAALTASRLSRPEQSAVHLLLGAARSAEEWRQALEGVDELKLTVRPKRAFKLTGSGPARIGMSKDLPEDDRLVVADVAAMIDDRPSPAAAAQIPRGAVILRANNKPVTTWAELTETLRAEAGRRVRVSYRTGTEYRETPFEAPDSLTTSLKLPSDARLQTIAGLDKAEVKGADDKPRTLYLPDWQAVRALLKQNAGKTVPVRWADAEGMTHDALYAVRADNVDPWLARVAYAPQFVCWPMWVDVRIGNPLEAMWAGIRKTYVTTLSVFESIRHIAFTRQLGVEKLSGPVGIARTGMEVAEAGWIPLLYFLCLISANLAVINALPLPIVDGGLFFFLLLEKLRGEPVSIKTQALTQIIGIVLIAGVFLFVTAQDILK